MADDDAILVRQTLDGRLEAFGRLVERYSGLVYALILERIRRSDEVEDLVQEAFCAAYQSLGNLRDPARFAPWLAQIARATVCHWLRREGNRARVEQVGSADLILPVIPPDAEIEQQEQAHAVWQALDQLPEDARLLVVLRHLEGCSYREVARFLGLSLASVRWRLLRAEQQVTQGVVQLLGEEARIAAADRQRLQRRILAGLSVSVSFILPSESLTLPAIDDWSLFGLLKWSVPGLAGLVVVGGVVAHLAGVELPGWGGGPVQERISFSPGASQEVGMRIKLEPPPSPSSAEAWEPPPTPPDPLRLAALGSVTATAQADTVPGAAPLGDAAATPEAALPGEKTRRTAPEPQQEITARSNITVVEVVASGSREVKTGTDLSNQSNQCVPELVAFLDHYPRLKGRLVWQRLPLDQAIRQRPHLLFLRPGPHDLIPDEAQVTELRQYLQEDGTVFAEALFDHAALGSLDRGNQLRLVTMLGMQVKALLGIPRSAGAEGGDWTVLQAGHPLVRDPFELPTLAGIAPGATPLHKTMSASSLQTTLEVLLVHGRVAAIYSTGEMSGCWQRASAGDGDCVTGLQFGVNLLTYASTNRAMR